MLVGRGSEAVGKLMRAIDIARWALVAAVLIGLFINARVQESIVSETVPESPVNEEVQESIQARRFESASTTALRAAQAQDEAYERLEVTGLSRYFHASVIANIQQQIEDLRAKNVYLTARIDREVLPQESVVQDEKAFIAFRETGESVLRSTLDGRIISRDPAYGAVLGFIMERSQRGQWLVTDWRVFDIN